MFLTHVKRIMRSGFFNFWRNGFVSLSSVLVMSATLFVIGGIIFLTIVLNISLETLKDKVDVNVYFNIDAQEEEILSLKNSLENLPETESVTYTTREEALANFKERHQDDQIKLRALEELDYNPLGAILNIKAVEPSQYEGIAAYLEDFQANLSQEDIIDNVNYNQNKVAINKLTQIIDSASRIGFAISIILIIIAVLITLNTIRLAIYTAREEISVMNLVGAGRWYIKGPFIITGVINGIVAGVLTLILFYPISIWLGGATEKFFVGINMFDYYLDNFGVIFLVIMASGIVVGAVSSYLAVLKYLK